MAFEVAEEGVIVGREVADGIVDHGRRVDDGLGMVREAGEVGAIFL